MTQHPNLFLIGAAKGGSTSFAFHLNDHPDIAFFAGTDKEPDIFTKDTVEACQARLEALAAQAPTARYLLDASVNYTQYPKFQNVPAQIAALCGREAPRFLYMIRNPVDRAISQYFWRRERYGEDRSPEEAIVPGTQYVDTGRYDLQIEQYLSVFSPEQVRFVVFDQYFADVPGEYAATCRWLGIDDSHSPDVTRVRGATNKKISRQSRMPALNRVARATPALRRAVKSLLPHKRQLQLTRALSKEVPRPEITPEIRAHLTGLFAESIARTEALTGLDLSLWTAPHTGKGAAT